MFWDCRQSFFTKKKLGEAGEVEGLMKSFFSSSVIYLFMDSDSGWDIGNILPLGGVLSGTSSIEQSHERWGGSGEAFALLNTLERSAYSWGSPGISGSSVIRVSCEWDNDHDRLSSTVWFHLPSKRYRDCVCEARVDRGRFGEICHKTWESCDEVSRFASVNHWWH